MYTSNYPSDIFLKQPTNFLSFSIAKVLGSCEHCDFFIWTREKQQKYRQHKSAVCSYAHTEFVFHCLPNASSPRCLEKKSVSCMATLMSHFPMKGQNFARFFFFDFFSMYILSFTMIFVLFNWPVFSSVFSYLLPLSEKKTQRNSP